MKKVMYIAVLSMTFLFGFGQNVPNPGFEAWIDYGSYEDPKNWQSPNEVTSGLGIFTVSKSTDTYSGNYSVRMESKNILGGLFKVPGTVTLGEFVIDINNQTAFIEGGVPFDNRPDKLKGFYKYYPGQGDFMQAFVFLYKHNQTTGHRDTIGTGYYSYADTVDTWSSFETDIIYTSAEVPDSLNIIIMASDILNAVQGSTLLVDSLIFDYTTVVEQPVKASELMLAYPNPCNQQITFDVAKDWEETRLSIYNSTGQLMFMEIIGNKKRVVSTGSYQDGVYFYRIKSGSEMKSGTFIVSH
jgi:hypothetical protein